MDRGRFVFSPSHGERPDWLHSEPDVEFWTLGEQGGLFAAGRNSDIAAIHRIGRLPTGDDRAGRALRVASPAIVGGNVRGALHYSARGGCAHLFLLRGK